MLTFPSNNTSPIEEICDTLLAQKRVKLLIKRDDLVHPSVSGNKWRKLKYNLLEAQKNGHDTLLTFGGAYSNHIHATAAAAKHYGFKSIGLIRGEHPKSLNPTLLFAQQMDMQLHFLSRTNYRTLTQSINAQQLQASYGNCYILPEGGTNHLAIKGCQEIVNETMLDVDYWCVSCGTGGTISGIISALNKQHFVVGFSVLKGDFLTKEVQKHLDQFDASLYSNWTINTNYHFGGYAKFKPPLIDFMNTFKTTHQIQLDPIYTGKMLYGIFDLVKKDYFPRGSTIVAVHTGGLQGIEGFNQRFGDLIIV